MTLSAQEFRKRHRNNALYQPLEKAQNVFRALRDSHGRQLQGDTADAAALPNTARPTAESNPAPRYSEPSAPPSATQASTRPEGATLYVGTRPSSELALALGDTSAEQSWTIGGVADADYAIPDSALRGLAFTIRYQDGCWFVLNDRSPLQLYVNGEPVRIAVLEHGDELHTGNLTIKFAQHLTRSLKLV